jgi:histidinol-phosphatase (PHP family)
VYDWHVHTSYSDGARLPSMVAAAAEAGLDGVGLTDHCTVTDRASRRADRDRRGFNLDATHERRRAAIERRRETASIAVFDGVEMDYHPADEAAIREFLDGADFDYAIGSVHEVDGHNVHGEAFADRSERERRAAVETYVDHLVALVESELFDVVGHADVFERNPALRGHAEPADYERIADAVAEHRPLVELNAGRIDREYGRFHPAEPLRAVLAREGVGFVPSTDAHSPADLRARVPALREAFESVPATATTPTATDRT